MGNIYGKKKNIPKEQDEKISLHEEITILEKKKKSVEALIRTFHTKAIESSENKHEALRFLRIKKRYEREANTIYCMLEKLEELKSASDALVIQTRVVAATAQASKQISKLSMDPDKVQETMDESKEAIERVNEVNTILSEQRTDSDLEAEYEELVLTMKVTTVALPELPVVPTTVPYIKAVEEKDVEYKELERVMALS